MAKEAKAEKATKEEKTKDKAPPAEKVAAPEFKFGVADVAKAMGINDASARVQLRNKGIKKAGKSYGWNTKDEVAEVVAKLRPEKEEKTSKDDKKDKKKS